MIFDWLAREGWIIVNWWLLATIAGFTALPLVMRFLGALPDKGYSLARPAGMLLITVTFWLLSVLGFVDNSPGSIILAWLIVLTLSLAAHYTAAERTNLRVWWQENRTLVIVVEILFVVLLVGWAIVRAYQHDINATEKPMDLAFMSASLRSETLPPHDPWLSGYIISYYYLGYVMAAMMSMMSGVWTTIGYNMHIAMLFALSGTAAFGVTYNLVRSRTLRVSSGNSSHPARLQSVSILVGLLGMVFVILLGNFQTALVELPYRSAAVSDSYLRFWDTKSRASLDGRTQAQDLLDPAQAGSTSWWWFDAARSITERNLDGERVNEVIDEFPQFSFLLADSHPHVMTLPYVLLAIGVALSVLLRMRAPTRLEVLFYGVIVGALICLNTWDAPIYLFLLVGADAVRRLIQSGRLVMADWLELFVLGISLFAVMVVTYLPFLIGFQSQFAGLLPNLLHPTRFQQLFIVFGPFMVLLAFYLGVETWRGLKVGRTNWRFGVNSAFAALGMLGLVLLVLVIVGRFVPSTYAFATRFVADNGGWDAVIGGIILRRISPLRLLTTVILLLTLALLVVRLFPKVRLRKQAGDEIIAAEGANYSAATGFALLLMGVGVLLVLVPEFFYLRDNFGTRMNTVFKFYYQAWVVFSIASAYAVYSILTDADFRPAMSVRIVFGGLLAVVLTAGLLYPVLGIYHRMFIETRIASSDSPTPLTLDGGQTLALLDNYEVLMCLNSIVDDPNAVVAEATGGSYDLNGAGSGKVGALTGLSSILGWQGHEAQWRGTAYASSVGTRVSDIAAFYQDVRMDFVQPVIDRYGVDYVLYGSTERERYGSTGEAKFAENMTLVCESGSSRIYRVDPPSVTTVSE